MSLFYCEDPSKIGNESDKVLKGRLISVLETGLNYAEGSTSGEKEWISEVIRSIKEILDKNYYTEVSILEEKWIDKDIFLITDEERLRPDGIIKYSFRICSDGKKFELKVETFLNENELMVNELCFYLTESEEDEWNVFAKYRRIRNGKTMEMVYNNRVGVIYGNICGSSFILASKMYNPIGEFNKEGVHKAIGIGDVRRLISTTRQVEKDDVEDSECEKEMNEIFTKLMFDKNSNFFLESPFIKVKTIKGDLPDNIKHIDEAMEEVFNTKYVFEYRLPQCTVNMKNIEQLPIFNASIMKLLDIGCDEFEKDYFMKKRYLGNRIFDDIWAFEKDYDYVPNNNEDIGLNWGD